MPTGTTVAGEGPNGTHELRRWLHAEPQLRGRIRSGATLPAGRPAAANATTAEWAAIAPGVPFQRVCPFLAAAPGASDGFPLISPAPDPIPAGN
ncbi:hypothetical protein [Streptomyces sp. CS147]|uniref:hypothetical protein n=1 Tax=Streptomyces sp. CS147 TaxID=2162715 RepID=UPI0013A535EA|nr:hypothetical protein [Streptomyces sp. CS147]